MSEQVTLVVDGVEVAASEGAMLVDAAKGGDVEIPVFCYEPKLGEPVGACRMCLVEVEGIPKLQTACSTPVRDGMVVYTQTDRVKEAQNAVVEFLLVNHPLDCPVCDKGGECPLQDISMGWGPGRSRFTEPKRHFQKPIPLSPLVRIDRERCILCYRCVRFSQEVAEDEQLQLIDRGAASYVGTFDDRPYIAPFHGNVIELCPVGALTSEAYRFRARPWDIEDAGSVCTLCPSQCNVKFTVRDEQVRRVLARDNAAVDDGWLCDKGRFGFQMMSDPDRVTGPLVRRAGKLAPATWEEALEAASEGLRAGAGSAAAIVGGGASNEEGYLVQRLMRGALGSPNVDSRPGGGPGREVAAAAAAPELSAPISAIDTADAVLVVGVDPLHAMPILDLRLRKAMRRNDLRVAIASERPTAIDGGSEESVRYAPGDAARFLSALAAELGPDSDEDERADGERSRSSSQPDAGEYQGDTGGYPHEASLAASSLRPGSTVIVYGERIGHGPNGEAALGALLRCARALGLDADGAGLIEVPDTANGRGLREAGCTPGWGPGYAEREAGMDAAAIRAAGAGDELEAMLLFESNPVRDLPGGSEWQEALSHTDFVVAFSMFADESAARADVVFPAESHAEKEGTVTHPDGRLQRVRPNVPHPGGARPPWQVLAELCSRLGEETGVDSAEEALAALAAEVPFLAGVAPEEIGGGGVRWQEREAASSFPPHAEPRAAQANATSTVPTGALRLGTYRDLWSGEVTERNPALRFLAPRQTVELAPADADRLGVSQGDEVDVRSNGTALRATVAVRERMRPGAAFLIEGTAEQNATALAGAETVALQRADEGGE